MANLDVNGFPAERELNTAWDLLFDYLSKTDNDDARLIANKMTHGKTKGALLRRNREESAVPVEKETILELGTEE